MVDLYRIRSVWTGVAGTPWYTNHYYQAADGTAQQAADATQALWNARLTYLRTGLRVSVAPEVITIDDATGLATDATEITPGSAVGTDASDALPNMTCALVRLRTGAFTGGRRLAGRFFWGGFTEANSLAGMPSPGLRGDLQASLSTWLLGANSTPVVYSKTYGTSAVITAATVWTEWSGLRSHRD